MRTGPLSRVHINTKGQEHKDTNTHKARNVHKDTHTVHIKNVHAHRQ